MIRVRQCPQCGSRRLKVKKFPGTKVLGTLFIESVGVPVTRKYLCCTDCGTRLTSYADRKSKPR